MMQTVGASSPEYHMLQLFLIMLHGLENPIYCANLRWNQYYEKPCSIQIAECETLKMLKHVTFHIMTMGRSPYGFCM